MPSILASPHFPARFAVNWAERGNQVLNVIRDKFTQLAASFNNKMHHAAILLAALDVINW